MFSTRTPSDLAPNTLTSAELAVRAGGVRVIDLTETKFLSNTAGYDGGGADALGTATLNGVLFQYNQAQNSGGGLHAWRTYLTRTQFLNNWSDFGGGAVTAGAVGDRYVVRVQYPKHVDIQVNPEAL